MIELAAYVGACAVVLVGVIAFFVDLGQED
jgi:hypothetical protein